MSKLLLQVCSCSFLISQTSKESGGVTVGKDDKKTQKLDHLKFEIAQEMGIASSEKTQPPQKEIKNS
ncbi:MAG TPA: hypothetical protein DER60_08375 [Syntrophomonas sp.]|nr:hypothetical protein [Syntrophomonas sp.]